jgi:hypothetical protein
MPSGRRRTRRALAVTGLHGGTVGVLLSGTNPALEVRVHAPTASTKRRPTTAGPRPPSSYWLRGIGVHEDRARTDDAPAEADGAVRRTSQLGRAVPVAAWWQPQGQDLAQVAGRAA